MSKWNEKLSLVSRAAERNKPLSLTTVCGSSSLFVQVTVEPADTVIEVGANMKSFAMTMVEDSGAAPAEAAEKTGPREAPGARAWPRGRLELRDLRLARGACSPLSLRVEAGADEQGHYKLDPDYLKTRDKRGGGSEEEQ